jgi:hypothetical protein
MRRFVLAATTVLALSAGPALAQEVVNFTIEGTNLDGSPYGGTASITWISDSTCTIVWTTGPDSVEGICMRNGIAFAAAYTFPNGANGLVVYEIVDEPQELRGIWTVTGLDGYGTEVLKRQQ